MFTEYASHEAAEAGVTEHLRDPQATCTCMSALALETPAGERVSRQARRAWEREQRGFMRRHALVCREAKRRTRARGAS